ncbi:unnamed protein product [Paramecium sonneborni]|uniref:Uncharacterized protein n=1 Tax=Paramecium sonneborni TaxID=65129 RepID=A0A8S1LS85_9CILI|nr:unnamed protein product [Paramecium sonneborni]
MNSKIKKTVTGDQLANQMQYYVEQQKRNLLNQFYGSLIQISVVKICKCMTVEVQKMFCLWQIHVIQYLVDEILIQ